MAFSPNFTTSESLGTLSNVTFTDTSTGSQPGLTSRRISIRLANGNWLDLAGAQSTTIVYQTWPIADIAITLNLLVQSTTGRVLVEWLTGSTVTESKTILQEWDLYDYVFAFGLIQSQTATPNIINDQSYYSNFFRFITNIFCSEAAVVYGDDLYSSQSCLNNNQLLINSAQDYF